MPVGPELPPHLAKRKRSIDDNDEPNSPPRKLQASEPRILGPAPPPANPDELDLEDDSSEDDYGPALNPAKASDKSATVHRVGPSLPPSKNPDELNLDKSSSESDSYGPSAPSNLTSKPSPPLKKRILGPAPPPASLDERPSQPADEADSSNSDDDFGPSLPPAPGSHAESQFLLQREQEATLRAQESRAQAAAGPKRDDWMLVPPSDSDWGSRVDPTKLKNRKFQSGKGSKAPIEKSGGISALWTETPEQKRQRLEDEVLGRTETALNSSKHASSSSSQHRQALSKEDEATARRIQEYNEKNRNRSLYAEHSERQGEAGKEKEDDPSKRAFDREKDMAVGGRLGHGEKREMLAKARDFGSRFQKGRYL